MKFRLPYPDRPHQPKHVEYLDGWIFKQAWAPQTSTETRLVPYGDVKIYDGLKYEAQMFYHNTQIRENNVYNNPITHDLSPINPPELLNDFDSTLECMILMDYYMKYGEPISIDAIANLSNLITVKINEGKDESAWYTLSRLREDPFTIKRKFKTI